MTQKFDHYCASYIKWTKLECEVGLWFLISIIAGVLVSITYDYDACLIRESMRLGLNLSDITMLEVLCESEGGMQSWAISFIVVIFLRILVLIRRPEWLSMGMGLIPVRFDGRSATIKDKVLFGIVEWFPLLCGAIYVLLFNPLDSLYSLGVYNAFVIGIQFIWIAPVLFKFKGKNISEMLSGFTMTVTEKQRVKLEASYNKRYKRYLGYLSYGIVCSGFLLFVSLAALGVIQFMRVPPENPAYQRALYEGTAPIWHDNVYFALTGLSAPDDVKDFYQYGRKKTYDQSQSFELMKQLNDVDPQYIFAAPILEGMPNQMPKGQTLSVNKAQWKKLDCLYNLHAINNDQCARFADLLGYIENNRVIWDRFNHAPDFGNIYNVPPQLLGGQLDGFVDLAKLKAAHIVYLAENGQRDEAMQEWLRYMKLYRLVAVGRDTMVNKAVISINVKVHLFALEKLLYVAPELAAHYQNDIIQALDFEGLLFNESQMLALDWGLMEPYTLGRMGNANALHNEFYKCIVSFEALANTPTDAFDYQAKDMVLCPLGEDRSPNGDLLYAAKMPGNFVVNVIYTLLMQGVLKGDELIKSMKITQVLFRQAQLGVEILAQDLNVAEAAEFVRHVGKDRQNPITNRPFKWDAENGALSFARPDVRRDQLFKLNLPVE